MKYLHTMVRISDLDASLTFYRDLLGMKEIRRYDNPEGKYTLVFLAADQDEAHVKEARTPALELTYNWDSAEEYTTGRSFGHLAYTVKDIYALCAKLQEAGITINRPPRDGRMAFIRSPDGISIELLQEGDPLSQQEPWLSMSNTGTW